jgi:chorismate-pyruvate lyase
MTPVAEVSICDEQSVVADAGVTSQGRWQCDDLAACRYVGLGDGPTPPYWENTRTSVTFLAVPVTFDEAAQRKRRLWQDLSPMQRALLATDGSFTLLLQALADEEICVKILSQTVDPAVDPDETLGVHVGEDIMTRSVLLHTSSGRKLVYARSRIVPHRLSRSIVHELQAGTIAIGLLLRRARLELFRELLDWGECELADEGREQLGQKRCIYRSYTIISAGHPVMEVAEFFSSTLFGERWSRWKESGP